MDILLQTKCMFSNYLIPGLAWDLNGLTFTEQQMVSPGDNLDHFIRELRRFIYKTVKPIQNFLLKTGFHGFKCTGNQMVTVVLCKIRSIMWLLFTPPSTATYCQGVNDG